ncbi:hypothetical protein ALQ53_102517 [Pseudomonas cannabina]|uniref:Uncharacterized protein n=1 Tax=Pseudomonas cannabina TaxID=86840 RepID=A0A3M3Q6N1_PSECA|nr:hypothetical protein ALQ53_102517 [Pseudomonas cannabina]RMN82227.1 hypothetical protein ALQ52_103186 [Pseudomonas cannabina pv. alisalensis]RMN86414.1 hypothetical protein ALQ51_101479 [Pseudomonas cannabina]
MEIFQCSRLRRAAWFDRYSTLVLTKCCDAERAERDINYRAALCVVMPFRTLRVLLATQSVENCIPTLERAERSSQLSCGALRRMPFRTLRVLLATQSVETCIPTLERAERSSQLSCGAPRRHAVPDAPRPLGDAERRDLHSHAGACGTIIATIVRRSASYAFWTLRVLLKMRRFN